MIWILVALAVTLFLLDIWISTGILSHLALLILAGVAASHVTAGWEWRIAVFLACYLVTIAVYYLFWKQIMLQVVNRAVAPTRHVPEFEKIVGSSGEIVIQKGKTFVRVNGILWPVTADDFDAGDKVVVGSVSDGRVDVRLVH